MAGDIKVSSNFEISAQKPLDGNINVLSVADRDSMPLIKRYDRMIVAVQGDYTYQLVLGTVDNDLSNNANWVKFGAASWADIENKPTEFEALPHTHEYIIYSETLIPTYVFGGYTAGMVTYSVKQYVINFVGEDKYINEVTAGNNHGANYLEVYEDGSLIYEQPFTFQYVDGRYRFDINEPFKAFSGKNYSLLFRRTDNTAFSATFYTSGVYYENAIAYNPVLFTVDYVLSDDSNTTGFDQSPIYYLRGSDFAKVEATGSQVQVIAEQFTVKSNTVIKKDLIVEGNIIQQGAAYETHAEQLYSTKDMLKQHLLEYSYCRMATFSEQLKFRELAVQQCKLSDIGIARNWNNKKHIKLCFEFKPIDIIRLNRVGESYGLKEYREVILKLLNAYKQNNFDKIRELEKIIAGQKQIMEQIKDLLKK